MEILVEFFSRVNILDAIIVIVFLFYAFEGYSVGFVVACLDFLTFIASFLLALVGYSVVSSFLVAYFSLPQGFSHAFGFFTIALVTEIILGLASHILLSRYLLMHSIRKINKAFGIIPGLLSAFVLLSFLLSLVVSLPLSPLLKHSVAASTLGNSLVASTQGLEKTLGDIFGGAVNETLTFLTIEPKSNESVSLNFTTVNVSVAVFAESEMFALVNKQRAARALPLLAFDVALTDLGRAHCKDMFARGYFSHFTPGGLSPFDRMAKANIQFSVAGENLALAPNTLLAMQGLMQSPGHKANILSPNFGRLGVGVIDGGMYGQMFCQEFTD